VKPQEAECYTILGPRQQLTVVRRGASGDATECRHPLLSQSFSNSVSRTIGSQRDQRVTATNSLSLGEWRRQVGPDSMSKTQATSCLRKIADYTGCDAINNVQCLVKAMLAVEFGQIARCYNGTTVHQWKLWINHGPHLLAACTGSLQLSATGRFCRRISTVSVPL